VEQRSTGKPTEVQMAHLWTFGDGKIILMQQHFDTLKVQELSALSVFPVPEGLPRSQVS
jgi:ketosteroid isomerase-like protein